LECNRCRKGHGRVDVLKTPCRKLGLKDHRTGTVGRIDDHDLIVAVEQFDPELMLTRLIARYPHDAPDRRRPRNLAGRANDPPGTEHDEPDTLLKRDRGPKHHV
jgi:hypothetical protein